MTRQLTRLVKLSTIVAAILSILLTGVWVTIRVVLIQQGNNEQRNNGCTNSSLRSPLKIAKTLIIIPSELPSSSANNSNYEQLQAVTSKTTTSTITTKKPCTPIPPDEIDSGYDVHAAFCLTGNIIWCVLNVAAQIFLYFGADRRSIRKTQIFVIFMITSTIIYSVLSVYLLIMSEFQDFAMTAYNAVTGGLQLYFVLKFLKSVIASSPRASLVDHSSSSGSTNNDDGPSGGQE